MVILIFVVLITLLIVQRSMILPKRTMWGVFGLAALYLLFRENGLELDVPLVMVVLGCLLLFWNNRVVGRKRVGRSVRAEMWRQQRHRCYYCGAYLETPSVGHVDHVFPLARGGSNAEANLVLACPLCNQSKGSRTTGEAGMYRHDASLLERVWHRVMG